MGHRFLHQSHAARRGCEISARGERGRCGSQRGGRALSLSLGPVENLGLPRHLDRFQLGFARLGGVVFEAGERDHIFVQVGETDRERVELRMSFREQNPDVVRIAPGEFFWHSNSAFRLSLFAIRLVSFTFVHPRSKAKQRIANSWFSNALPKRNSGSTPSFPRPLCPVS